MERKLLRLFADRSITYWEIRNETIKTTALNAWNKETKDIVLGEKNGHSVRVLYKNGWGFVSSDGTSLAKSIKKAMSIAKSLNTSMTRSPATRSVWVGHPRSGQKKSLVKIAPDTISLEEKKSHIVAATTEYLQRKFVKSVQVSYSDSIKDSSFWNAEGTEIHQQLTYAAVSASMTVKNKTLETFDERAGGVMGYEVTKALPEVMASTYKNACILTKARVPKGGMVPVLCDPQLTEVLIHEAVGHATEADIVLQKESCLQALLGKQIAPSFLTISDDPTLKGLWGSYFYDDEGVPAQKTSMVKHGILQNLLHTRETAAAYGTSPTGNARAQSVEYLPQVRMSNTYLEKGDHRFEELAEKVKDGLYLIGSRGGQADTPTGDFHFSAQMGYKIKNSRITEPVKGVSLLGNTLRTLYDIRAIGNTYGKGSPGYCGKGGQYVPVIGNCPPMVVGKAIIGGKA
ncbi:TldD/PmbA family protein [Candidatus Woesearchaeota archaeon]|nr:TldD/PmbA family protein [Candidatus Woesearchaeota archaeon]